MIVLATTAPDTTAVVMSCALRDSVAREIHEDISNAREMVKVKSTRLHKKTHLIKEKSSCSHPVVPARL